jgi:glycosyltransferase involved in cell wall biosynthesis
MVCISELFGGKLNDLIMISLVLATLGRVREVERLLETLNAQVNRDFEVIVVDQNTDDRLCSVLDRAVAGGLSVKHLRLQPPNLSEARNLGISEASGEIIGFPDDDCWYEPGTLDSVAGVIDGNGKVGGVVGYWVEQNAALPSAARIGELHAWEWERFRGGDASSITLFFRLSVLKRLGGFDVRFGVGRWFGAGEETDLVLRALRSEVVLWRVSEVRVHHDFGNRDSRISMKAISNARQRGRGTGGLYAKHALPFYVISRGFISGWLKPLFRFSGYESFMLGVAESIGRIEGFIRWKMLAGGRRA